MHIADGTMQVPGLAVPAAGSRQQAAGTSVHRSYRDLEQAGSRMPANNY